MARSLLAVALSSALAACAPPPGWLAGPERAPALVAASAPTRCEEVETVFRPGRPALLGRPTEDLARWTKRAFTNHYGVGRRGQVGLVPNEEPGVAMQATTRRGRVAFISVQSHERSASAAAPLARQAVHGFLLRATGCESYRLCEARVDLDEAIYRGRTACAEVAVPVRIVTSRGGRSIVGVATWLPRGLLPAEGEAEAAERAGEDRRSARAR